MFEKILAYVDNLATQVEVAMAKYAPLCFEWASLRLEGTDPMGTLSMAIIAIFALVVYVWFRNR